MGDVISLRRSAIHEGGHIIAGLCVGDPLKIVSVNINVDYETYRGGCVETALSSKGEYDDEGALAQVVFLFGGFVAEALEYNEASRNAATDTNNIRSILSQLESDAAAFEDLCYRCFDLTARLMRPHIDSLRDFANALERQRRMTRVEIDAYLHIPSRRDEIDWAWVRWGRSEA